MYDSEPLQDQCFVPGHSQLERSMLETRVISPSVEGLTFNDYDVLACMFASELPPAAAVANSSDDVLSNTTTTYLSDAWKLTDRGPTLTQLNSEDLEATLLDDFGVTSSGFCVDMSSLDCSQLIAVKPLATSTTCVPSAAAAAMSGWSEQIKQEQHETVDQHQQQLMSQRPVDSDRGQWQHAVSHSTTVLPSTSVAVTTQLSLDRSWETIESFLKSEDERMAAQASSSQQLQLTANIKSEVPGSCPLCCSVMIDE